MRTKAHPGHILRIPVESDAADALGYKENTETLRVWYTGGRVYDYYEVPPEEFDKLMHADSIGAYLNRFIKPYYECDELKALRSLWDS